MSLGNSGGDSDVADEAETLNGHANENGHHDVKDDHSSSGRASASQMSEGQPSHSSEPMEEDIVKSEPADEQMDTDEPNTATPARPEILSALAKDEEDPWPNVIYADDVQAGPMTWKNWLEQTDTPTVPTMTKTQRERLEALSSLMWNDFYNNGDPTSHEEKEILYRGFKRREAEINYIEERIRTPEIWENAKKKRRWVKILFRRMMSMGHVTLLAHDWCRAHSAYKYCFRLSKEEFARHSGAYFGLGLVYFHFKKFKLAIEAFNTQLYYFPELDIVPDIHCRLGSSFKHLEQYGLALKHYTCAFSDCRDSWFHTKTQLRICIALCHSLSGDLQKAYDDLKKLEEELGGATATGQSTPSPAVSDRATVLRELGWVCYQFEHQDPGARTAKLEEAEGYLNKSKELEPNHGKTYYYLGRCFGENKGRAHDAFLHYRQAIDKSEGDADTWCSIGLLYQDQNQPMDALQAFICAVELNPEHSPAWTNLGQLYLKEQQFPDALECFKQALKHNPVCPAPLKQHIAILESEINIAGAPSANRTTQPKTPGAIELPPLDQAHKQPIPSELRTRQNDANLAKQFRYREGSPLWKMAELGVCRKRHIKEEDDEEGEEDDEMDLQQVAVYSVLEPNKKILDAGHKSIQKKLGKMRKPSSDRDSLSPMSMADLLKPDASSAMQYVVSDLAYKKLKEELELEAIKEEAAENQPPKKPKLHKLPHKFSLLAPLNLGLDVTAEQVLTKAAKRIDCLDQYEPIFEEDVPPPEPPKAPKVDPEKLEKLSKRPELGYQNTPLINVESRAEAQLTALQQYLQAPKCCVANVRGLTSVLRMDLSLFSTKTLTEMIPEETIEVRTQYRMDGDRNVNQAGLPTWEFYSAPGNSKVIDYAQYQAQTFKHCLKEEEEKLRKSGAKYGQQDNGKKASQNPQIKFGTNIDLSEPKKYPRQIKELQKLPAFCRPGGASDMLSHLGFEIMGMNTVQMYMKVPGARTPAHVENNCFASVNVNIGPGDCEWFAVPYEYWSEINRMCNERKIDFLRDSWWPDVKELLKAGIPVYRFMQKAGDVVWVAPGCVHWVQATGWCNNIAWNVGPLTAFQLDVSLVSYEWNKLTQYNSLVPMQLLCWQLAKNIQFTNQAAWSVIRGVLIRSLAYCKMIAKYVESCGKVIKYQPRQPDSKGREPTCVLCEVEVFNILFVKQENTDRSDAAYFNYCVNCARKKKFHKDESFYVLQQITFDELIAIFDKFQLTPNSRRLNLVA
ncbi:unnamed protein product, partial [Mesorhabditis spiculigera]